MLLLVCDESAQPLETILTLLTVYHRSISMRVSAPQGVALSVNTPSSGS